MVAARDVWWKWDQVNNAVRYEVTVDGNVAGETDGTEWISKDIWTGEHSMTVKAIRDTGEKSGQSKTAKINVTGSSSDAPQPAPPPPQNSGGDPGAQHVQSFIDPDTYNYPEARDKQGWEVVFSDEFNGTALNPYRWHSQLRWDGDWNGSRFEYRVINREAQYYVNVLGENYQGRTDEEHKNRVVPLHNPFKFDGNRLAIQAVRNPLFEHQHRRDHGSLDEIVKQQPFLSGVIASHNKHNQKYGYFEARIKIPSEVGTFPAFWLHHERKRYQQAPDHTRRSEIDIMENLGHAPQYVYNSFHYYDNTSHDYPGDWVRVPTSKGQTLGKNYSFVDGGHFSNKYHVYAVEWSPGKAIWYIDGVEVSRLDHGGLNFEEKYVIMNLAIGGDWMHKPKSVGGHGRPDDQRYPTDADINSFGNPKLEIDYVRVYKRK